MRFDAEATSGYLQKTSGIDWADCVLQDPTAWAGSDLYLGKRYWTTLHPTAQHWGLWRAYLSFDTSALARKTVKSAALVLTVKTRGAGYNNPLWFWSQGTTPWGTEVDELDWPACNLDEGLLAVAGVTGQTHKLIKPASINTTGKTQFRLRFLDSIIAPTGDEHLVFYGADDALRRPYLLIDTGNVYDDVCLNLAQVLNAYKTELGALVVHDNLPETAEVDHVYVGCNGGQDEVRQRISVDVYWVGARLGDTTGAAPSLERAARQKADLMRRIIRMDGNCNGYCTELETCVAEVATGMTVLPWDNDDLLLGCALRVTYLRELGLPGDIERM